MCFHYIVSIEYEIMLFSITLFTFNFYLFLLKHFEIVNTYLNKNQKNNSAKKT